MTDSVAAQIPVTEHVGNGVTTSFAYTFTILDSADMVVEIDGVAQGSGFTVSGVGVLAGGAVLFTSAPASGVSVLLRRSTDLSRSTSYTYAGDLRETVVDEDFNRLWHAMQERAEVEGRALRAPIGETLSDLPPASVRAGRLASFNAVTGDVETVAPVDGSATALAIDLSSTASGKGAALVGVEDAGGYYTATTAEGALQEIGASQRGIIACALTSSMTAAQVDAEITAAQAAAVAAGGGTVLLPPGSYPSQALPAPVSGVFFRSAGGRGATLLYRDDPTAGGHWCSRDRDGMSVANYGWINVAFDGRRANFPYASALWYQHVFYFGGDSSAQYAGLYWIDCDFRNCGEDAIRVAAWSTTMAANHVRVLGCTMTTDSAYRYSTSTDGTALTGVRAYSGQLYRQVQIYEWYETYGSANDADHAYGRINFTDTVVSGCSASYVRTLADIKRGSKSAVISGNYTYNMGDCHHSVDGSFDVLVSGNVGAQDTTITGGTNTNFVEIQGERVAFCDNVFDGGATTKDGIFVHDYQGPWGTPSGHGEHGQVSKTITVHGNTVRNVKQTGIKAYNVHGGSVTGNVVEQCGYYGILHASGASRYASDGTTRLYGKSVRIADNYVDSCGVDTTAFGTNKPGVSCQHANGVPYYADVLGSNTDASGIEHYYVSGGCRPFGPSATGTTTYTRFVRAGSHKEFNANRWLEINVSSTAPRYWDHSTPSTAAEITALASLPTGVPVGIKLGDTDSLTAKFARASAGFPAQAGDVIYVRCWIKRDTSSAESIMVQEKTGATTYLSTNFLVPVSAPTAWTEYLARFLVTQGDNCQLSLVPAASYNNPAGTGASDWADVRVGVNQVPA